MTILFLTRKFPPSTGGMENYAYDLYCALDKEVNVKLVKWGGANKYLPLVLPYFFFRACAVLLAQDIDIIHAQDGIVSSLAYVLSRFFKKPFTVVIHGLDITHKNALFQAIIPRFVSKADEVFCISQAAADETVQRGTKRSKIRVIPIGMKDEKHAPKTLARQRLHQELRIDKSTPVLITVGRLVKRKGVAWFVANVMPELVRARPSILYAVVGGGEEEDNIRNTVAAKKLANNVRMLGRVPDAKLPMIYNGSDVFVQPNITVSGDIEGFGLVLLEASLCELPIVAAGIEGIKDAIIDGENGVLVDAKDTMAYVREIERFISDSKVATAFGARSRAYTLEHYQWDNIVKEYIKGYKGILSLRGNNHNRRTIRRLL